MIYDEDFSNLINEKNKLENENFTLNRQLKAVEIAVNDYYQNSIKNKNFDNEIENLKDSKYYQKLGEPLLEIQRNKQVIFQELKDLENNLKKDLNSNREKQDILTAKYKRKLSDDSDKNGIKKI